MFSGGTFKLFYNLTPKTASLLFLRLLSFRKQVQYVYQVFLLLLIYLCC